MGRRTCRSAAFGILASALALATGVRAQQVGGVQYVPQSGPDPATFNMDVFSAPLSRLSLDYSPTLTGSWSEVMPPLTALHSKTPLSVPLVDMPRTGFFRARVEPPRIKVTFEGGQFVLTVLEDDTDLDGILIGLFKELGEFPFYGLPYDPDSEETHPFVRQLPPVDKGVYTGRTLGDLGKALGLHLWEPSPAEDDEKIAAGFIPLPDDRGKPVEVPGDGGRGEIGDGWEGDEIKALPQTLADPPDPGKLDMKYVPEVAEEDPAGQVREVDTTPGKHVRLRVVYNGIDFFFQRAVAQETGSGLLDKPFPVPPEGSFLLVVRNAAGGIYHVMPFDDPRNERAYDPPKGGSHGHQVTPEGTLRLTLPIVGDDIGKALAGLQVHIVRVERVPAGDVTLLTPLLIDRHPNDFPIVGAISGEDVGKLLAAPGPRTPKTATKDPEATTIHRSGSNGSKFNIAVMGDGFRDTVGDQTAFNDYVRDVVMNTFLTRDIHPSILNGANIFRVNTFSTQSGITLVNSAGTVTTTRSTALEYRFSGDWNRCWMEPGPNSQALIDDAIDDACPQADFVVLVLNTPSFGGCAGGNRFTVTLGGNWSVVAHEFGHRPGTLGDEYTCGSGSCGCYGNGEPGAGNLTKNTTRSSLKWNMWVPPWRPLPTTLANIASNTQDVGLFPGATIGQGQWTSCIFRPSSVGRMNNNSPVHNPVGHTNVREQFRPYQKADLRRNVTGDFNGDGRTDVVLLDDRQLALYLAQDRNVGANDPVRGSPPRGVTGTLNPTWYNTDYLRNAAQTRSWQIRGDDLLFPGDFDGDGLDDLYIANLTAWDKPYLCLLRSFGDHFEPVRRYDGDLPGWQTRAGDKFLVGDFSGDGKDDLMVFNGSNWSVPYFGMMKSTGTALQMSRRYDQYLPGWEMGRHEKFSVADFNGDGRIDVVSFNTQSWAQVHLMLFSSTGTQLSLQDRYYGTIPGFWQMRRNDFLHVLDFSGDGKSDIALFNGLDWGPTYLGYLTATDGKLSGARRYDNANSPLPGWQLQRRDRFYPSNPDGDADDDLVVYNKDNWSTQYLGILKSSGGSRLSVQGSWQDDWIDGWNLGGIDRFSVAEFRGGAKWDDLYVFNDGWFGMLRGYQTHFRLETIYRKWIFNHRYHASGWW